MISTSNAEMTERVFQQIKTAFLQDVEVFTAQQRTTTQRPDAPTSTSTPTPAACRPAASSTGSTGKSRAPPRTAWPPNSRARGAGALNFRVELVWKDDDDNAVSSMYLTSDGRVILQGRAISTRERQELSLPPQGDMISVDRNLIRAIKEML